MIYFHKKFTGDKEAVMLDKIVRLSRLENTGYSVIHLTNGEELHAEESVHALYLLISRKSGIDVSKEANH